MGEEGVGHRAVHGPEVAGAGHVADRFHAVGGDGLVELLLDEVEGLVPGDFLELPRALVPVAQQRHRQALRVVGHVGAGDTAAAGSAVVQLGRLHLHQLAVHHIALEVVMLALRRARGIEDLRALVGILARRGQPLLGGRVVGGRRRAPGQARGGSRGGRGPHEGATGKRGVCGAFAVLRHRTLLPQIGFPRGAVPTAPTVRRADCGAHHRGALSAGRRPSSTETPAHRPIVPLPRIGRNGREGNFPLRIRDKY